MAVSLGISAFLSGVPALMFAMCVWTLGMCFTWPNLEALVCDHEKPARLPKLIGVYNVVWSGGAAIAYFSGGAIAEAIGWSSIFWIPALIHALQTVLVLWLRPRWDRICAEARPVATEALHESHPDGPAFLRMAWLANPFAYVAINAAIPLIPDLANRLALSPKAAGFFCSGWDCAAAGLLQPRPEEFRPLRTDRVFMDRGAIRVEDLQLGDRLP